MSDVEVVMTIGLAIALVVLQAIFMVSPNSVIAACEKNGYWQTGQTRIICSVEKSK